MATTRKTPQTMVQFSTEDYPQVEQKAIEEGQPTMSAFCRSVVLDYLAGRLIRSEESADTRTLKLKMAGLVEGVEALNDVFQGQIVEQKAEFEAIRKTVETMSRDSYDRTSRILGVIGRVEETVVSVFDGETNSMGLLTGIDRNIRMILDGVNRAQSGVQDRRSESRSSESDRSN